MTYTLLKTVAGSFAYGLDTPDSDRDYAVVYVEDPETCLGPAPRDLRPTHTIDETEDVQRYPLRHFLYLATRGNPSTLEVLFAPTVEMTDLGNELVSLYPAIISRQVVKPYRGFMKAQTLRLLGLKGQLRVTREHLRNAHGYDSKYAAHTLRLGYQALELLSNGTLKLPMAQDDQRTIQIRAVRAGRMPFQDWWNQIIALDAAVATAAKSSKLPEQPDMKAVSEFAIRAHIQTWLSIHVKLDGSGGGRAVSL